MGLKVLLCVVLASTMLQQVFSFSLTKEQTKILDPRSEDSIAVIIQQLDDRYHYTVTAKNGVQLECYAFINHGKLYDLRKDIYVNGSHHKAYGNKPDELITFLDSNGETITLSFKLILPICSGEPDLNLMQTEIDPVVLPPPSTTRNILTTTARPHVIKEPSKNRTIITDKPGPPNGTDKPPFFIYTKQPSNNKTTPVNPGPTKKSTTKTMIPTTTPAFPTKTTGKTKSTPKSTKKDIKFTTTTPKSTTKGIKFTTTTPKSTTKDIKFTTTTPKSTTKDIKFTTTTPKSTTKDIKFTTTTPKSTTKGTIFKTPKPTTKYIIFTTPTPKSTEKTPKFTNPTPTTPKPPTTNPLSPPPIKATPRFTNTTCTTIEPPKCDYPKEFEITNYDSKPPNDGPNDAYFISLKDCVCTCPNTRRIPRVALEEREREYAKWLRP